MTKNANRYNDDQLAIFENRVRSTGVWCDVSVKDQLAHKFVCKNHKATIAISLCASVIAPFEKLHENTVTKKCLVCSLFDNGESEVKDKLEKTLSRLSDEYQERIAQTVSKHLDLKG